MARSLNTAAAVMDPPVAARVRPRSRSRDLDLNPVANDSRAEQEARVLHALSSFWKANAAANNAASLARKAKTDLQKAMDEAKMERAATIVDLGTKTVSVEATILPSEADYIDVLKLKGLVDDATFMKIIKATKTDVIAHAGNNVAVMATATLQKPADLKVKEVK
jgi:hypothetical protein